MKRGGMTKVNYLAILVAVIAAFVASSLWYSPLLFGKQFIELSGFDSASAPNAWKAISELVRTSVLAYVIARLVALLHVSGWKGALREGLWLWVGFPAVLLSGSVLWQRVPSQLAAIHAGDWFIKILLIAVIVSIWRGRVSPGVTSQTS